MSLPVPPLAAIERECNSFVTDLCNRNNIRLTPKRYGFLKTAYYQNKIVGWYFSSKHFSMTKGNFRAMKTRLRSIIVQDFKSNPGSYRLSGIEITKKVTIRGMGVQSKVDPEYLDLIMSCKQQPVEMHNLRISTFSLDLYEKLVRTNHPFHPRNNQITLRFALGDYIHSVLNIFKTGTIQIIIACSQKPILYAPSGFNHLIFHLGRLSSSLEAEIGRSFLVPEVGEWIVDYIEFNQDGIAIDSKKYNLTITKLSEHSRFYIKQFDDGTVRPRSETRETPHKSISELQSNSFAETSVMTQETFT